MIALPPAELLANAEPEAVLRWTYERFAKVAIVASFQAESSVIIDIASRIRPDLRVLTLDTGRLPQQTHDMIDRVRERYGIEVEVITPDPTEIRKMVATHGANLFYASVESRRKTPYDPIAPAATASSSRPYRRTGARGACRARNPPRPSPAKYPATTVAAVSAVVPRTSPADRIHSEEFGMV